MLERKKNSGCVQRCKKHEHIEKSYAGKKVRKIELFAELRYTASSLPNATPFTHAETQVNAIKEGDSACLNLKWRAA